MHLNYNINEIQKELINNSKDYEFKEKVVNMQCKIMVI